MGVNPAGTILALIFAVSLTAAETEPPAGWGIDACLTAHVDARARSDYLLLLQQSGVRILRERGPNAALPELKNAGLAVDAFVDLRGLPPPRPGNQLPEDLLKVYQSARGLAANYRGIVDAWEMVGEPDVGYCTDLPDRVVAFQKAVYLGLKAGAGEGSGATGQSADSAPVVLMGALALPPGPWLDRAAANGIFEYTDAVNFHFYGLAGDLPGVIAAHRDFAAKHLPAKAQAPLPLWITECGADVVTPADYLNPKRRARQADFTLATAQTALRETDVAVFMPFILVHQGDPFAMTSGPNQPLPSWTSYARFTRENPWPRRPLARPPVDPNPIVLQWLPDNRTTVPHKVSGSYRFNADGVIQGELCLYNFSGAEVRGHLVCDPPKFAQVQLPAPGEIILAPFSCQCFPLEFHRNEPAGYFREEWSAIFQDEKGGQSPVRFALEAWPVVADFKETALPLLPDHWWRRFGHPEPTDEFRHKGKFWREENDLKLEELPTGSPGTRLRLGVQRVSQDPLRFNFALAHVSRLPSEGFLRLQLSHPMSKDCLVRVDLIDRRGQRFTIWENFGVSYYRPSADVWLNLRDFASYFWGRCTKNPVFHPEDIREVQVRGFFKRADDPVEVTLSLMQAVRR